MIVVSGFLDNTAAQTFINLGVSGIFLKPLNIFALLQRLEELFKGLVKASGAVIVEAGGSGLTKTPFGNYFNKELFVKKLQSLASFKGSLLLVGEAQSPFMTVAEAIVKHSPQGAGEKLLVWKKEFAEAEALQRVCASLDSGVKASAEATSAGITFFLRSLESLSAAEKNAIYKIAKKEAPFGLEGVPVARFIICLEQELDALYEKQIVDDEMYLFLGNLELRLPKGNAAERSGKLGGASSQTVSPLGSIAGASSKAPFINPLLSKEEALAQTNPGEKGGVALAGAATGGNRLANRILVLDDEDLHAQMLIDLLSDSGYSALKLNNPSEALVALKKERFSLVITDFRMPGINGVDFVAQLRQIDPTLPVFIVTGNIQLPEMVRIGNMGITRLIQKPIDVKTFIEQVRQVRGG